MNKSLNRYKQGCQFTTNLDSSEGSSVVEEEKSVKYNKDLLSELKQPNKSKSISQNENSLQFWDSTHKKSKLTHYKLLQERTIV